MERGRPKLEIARTERVHVRLTKSELEDLEKICEKLKISKTEAVIRGIKLLKNPPKQKIYRSLNKNPQKHSEGVTIED